MYFLECSCYLKSLIWHKAISIGHLVRIKLTNDGLLTLLTMVTKENKRSGSYRNYRIFIQYKLTNDGLLTLLTNYGNKGK